MTRESTPSVQAVQTAMTAAVERAVSALDAARLEREYWEQDEFLLIPRFLPPEAVAPLIEHAERLEPGVNRNYIPRHKKGGSVSSFAIAEEGPALLAFYHSEAGAGPLPAEPSLLRETGTEEPRSRGSLREGAAGCDSACSAGRGPAPAGVLSADVRDRHEPSGRM